MVVSIDHPQGCVVPVHLASTDLDRIDRARVIVQVENGY